jgi:excisionase family DNA binding protein
MSNTLNGELTPKVEPLDSPKAVAKRLGVSSRHVRNLADMEIIPSYRIGPRVLRFNLIEVEKALGINR